MKTQMFSLFSRWMVVILLLSACASPMTTAAPQTGAGVAREDYTTPHPILSDGRVRRAIAHCIDRDALIAAVYPYVEDKAALRMDSYLPKTHWAYGGPYRDYPYDPAQGQALLEEAGWTLPTGADFRVNAAGDVLALKFTTTNAQFRLTWAAVAEQNLAACGIQLVRFHVPASWWFGDTTGLARRDFELGGFAWVGGADPGSRPLYACDQIPLPNNNWEGQNFMGWCNPAASNAVVRGDNTLDRAERIQAYDLVQQSFTEDMVSLPLFQRAEAVAWRPNLEGVVADPTEFSTANAAQWKLKDGGDTVVLGFSQEPASLFTLVESAAVVHEIAQMGIGMLVNSYNYDFQPVLQDSLSTLESGLATNTRVKVKVGDMVYNLAGQPEALAAGTKVMVNGEIVEYDGNSELTLPQLRVTYRLNPYTWSDGTPGSVADIQLGHQITCDKQSGATTYIICDAMQQVEFGDNDLSMTVTYVPGYQYALYFLFPVHLYPSHQVVTDGRRLKDVPAAEWVTLPEIAEIPLSYGPFMLTEWVKGDHLTLAANPYYAAGTGVKRIVVRFIQDTNQAVAQLLSGEVDFLEKATLGGGAEVQTLLDAAKAGKVNIELVPSPTWEHIDMNLYTK